MPQRDQTHQPSRKGADSGHRVAAPIILFGALRSGTTLLRLMLNAHPKLNTPGEVDFLIDHIRPDSSTACGWRYNIADLRADRMFRAQQITIRDGLDGLDLLHDLLRQLAAKKPSGQLCVIMHRDLPVMLEILPGARVIHLLRDPRDVARSSVEMGWAGVLYHACNHWMASEQAWDRSCAMLRAQDWTELRFEALVRAPIDELTRICGFLGIPYSDKMLGYPAHSTYPPPNPNVAGQWVYRCAPKDVAEMESKISAMMTARDYKPTGSPIAPPGFVRRGVLALRHKTGIWTHGLRQHGAVPFFGVRLARKLRLVPLQRYFQRRIDHQIRQMLR